MLFVVIKCCWVTHLFWVWVAWIMQAVHMALNYLPVYLCVGRLSYLKWLCSWVYLLHIDLASDTSSLHIFEIFILDMAKLTLNHLSLIRFCYQTLVINHHRFMIHTNHLWFEFSCRRLLLRIWEIHVDRGTFWWHTPLLIHVQVLFNLGVFAILSYNLCAHIFIRMLEMRQCLNLHHSLFFATVYKFCTCVEYASRCLLHFIFLQIIHSQFWISYMLLVTKVVLSLNVIFWQRNFLIVLLSLLINIIDKFVIPTMLNLTHYFPNLLFKRITSLYVARQWDCITLDRLSFSCKLYFVGCSATQCRCIDIVFWLFLLVSLTVEIVSVFKRHCFWLVALNIGSGTIMRLILVAGCYWAHIIIISCWICIWKWT